MGMDKYEHGQVCAWTGMSMTEFYPSLAWCTSVCYDSPRSKQATLYHASDKPLKWKNTLPSSSW